MTIAAGLRTFLLADSTIASLIGSGSAARLYPVKLPQGPTMPAITYQTISGQRVHSADGASGLSGPRIQIDCWGSTYAQADALFEAVRKRLDGYRGPAGSKDIQGAFFDTERDFYEADAELYRKSADFIIWNTE